MFGCLGEGFLEMVFKQRIGMYPSRNRSSSSSIGVEYANAEIREKPMLQVEEWPMLIYQA